MPHPNAAFDRSLDVQEACAMPTQTRPLSALKIKRRVQMRMASALAATVFVIGTAATASATQAATGLPLVAHPAAGLTQIRDDDYDRDRHIRHDEDHDRGYWWWKTRRYERDGDSCREARHECAERFGWGTWRFERCVDRHGC
jgi:hypothetical protein